MLRDAPLGSYFGWNITSAGFHKDQNCDYAGGMVPFAIKRADRLATGDPRLSLEERYGTHARLCGGRDRGGGPRRRKGLPAARRQGCADREGRGQQRARGSGLAHSHSISVSCA